MRRSTRLLAGDASTERHNKIGALDLPLRIAPGQTKRHRSRTPVILLVQNLDVRVVNAATGELLRELTIDLTSNYQSLGRPPRPTPNKTKSDPHLRVRPMPMSRDIT